MFEPFILPGAQKLQEENAIALLRRLHRHPVPVADLVSSEFPAIVQTAVVTPSPASSTEIEPLLMLHGFDSSLLEFRHLFPLLEPHGPLYAVDLMGFGFTACPLSASIEPRTIRQHLYATWKVLIDRPVTLLGASLGGAVAIDFALHHPDCVERLILIDSVGFSGSFPVGKWLPWPLLDWGADWLRFRKSAALRATESIPIASPGQQDFVLCASLHQDIPGWKQSMKSFTRSGGYYLLSKRIPEIRQRTLILWGTQDTVLGTQDAQKFEQAIPHSRLVWVQRGDHAPHVNHPAAVAKAILKGWDL